MQLYPVPMAKKPQANDFFMNSYPKHWVPNIAQIIKAQRQILGFNLKNQKSKAAKPLKNSYL